MPFTTHFVLVHGACHGAWCWYKVRSLLESIGYKVSCPDLGGSGTDPSDANTIFTFETYNKPLDNILAKLPEGEKVILVGHSAGGLSLTKAIHDFPDKIQVAVFVGAVMLRNGPQTEQDKKDGIPDLSNLDVYHYVYGQGQDNPPTSIIFKKNAQRDILYQMSPLEDCTLAAMLLRPSPIRVFSDAIFLDDGKNPDTVPRVYIKILHDKVFSLEQQDVMIKRWPPSDVYTLDSDHCPMFSNPIHLFGSLVKIAAKFGCP